MGFSPLRVALTLSHHRNWDERQQRVMLPFALCLQRSLHYSIISADPFTSPVELSYASQALKRKPEHHSQGC